MVSKPRLNEAEAVTLARAALIWALITASVAYAVALTSVADLENFVGKNSLAAGPRRTLLFPLGAGVLVSLGLTVRAYASRGMDGAARLLQAARLFAPLSWLGPAVAVLAGDKLDTLARVGAMAVVALGFEGTLRGALGELTTTTFRPLVRVRDAAGRAAARLETAKVGRWYAVDVAVLVLGVAYATYAAYFSILRHLHFQTGSNDLGQYDNFFNNALHGHPFRSLPLVVGGNWSALRSHAEFSMVALLPFYALYPHAETLLVLQAILLGSAGVAVYRFTARRTTRLTGLALAVAYFVYAPLHGVNFYDVHFQPIGAAFTLWALDALDARRKKTFVVAFVLALASREDVALIFLAVGAYLVLTGRALRAGVTIALAAGAYFAVMKFIVMPRFGTWWYAYIYKELFPAGDETYGGVVKTLLSNPVFAWGTLVRESKLRYALQILTPLAFLPLRGRLLWLSVLPGAIVTLLTTAYAATVEISFQYSAYLIALIFPAAACALEQWNGAAVVRRRAAVGGLLAGTLLTTTAWGAIPPREHFRAAFTTMKMTPPHGKVAVKRRDLLSLAAKIPPRASVAVSEHELPHVSNRPRCYDLNDDYFDADYILYDRDSAELGADKAKQALDTGGYEHFAERGRIVLLRKKSLAASAPAPK